MKRVNWISINLFFIIYVIFTFVMVPNTWGAVSGNGSVVYYADPNQPDQGVTGNGKTIKAFVDAIGKTKKATIELRCTGNNDNTYYTVSSDLNIPANISLKINRGAILKDDSNNANLTLNCLIKASLDQQIFNWGNGTGNISISPDNVISPDMFGVDGTADDVQFQQANDALVSGGTIRLLNKTYVLDAPNLLTGVIYYAVKISSNITWKGSPDTVVQLAANQTASGHDPQIFCTDGALDNVIFKNFTIDINGTNNTLTSLLKTCAIYVCGPSAYGNNIKILHMKFENCPGSNDVVIGGSDSTTLGNNILVKGCTFYHNGFSSATTDHSSLYTWANNVRYIDNYFYNDSSDEHARLYATAFELHGNNNIATGNITVYYSRGCHLFGNYVAPVSNMVVSNNSFQYVESAGVKIWQDSSCKGFSNIIISNNTIELYDNNDRDGYGVMVTAGLAISNINISGNIFTKSGLTDHYKNALRVDGSAGSATISGLVFNGNLVSGTTQGCFIDTSSNTVNDVLIENNTFKNLNPITRGNSIGIYTTGSGLGLLEVNNNNFIDDRVKPAFTYGLYLSGTISKLVMNNNYYQGLVDQGLQEASCVIGQEIVNGSYEYYVAAAAAGSTNTFVITITLNDQTCFNLQVGLTGKYSGHNFFKRIDFAGYLNANTMYNGETAEITSLGDSLKSDLVASAPVAVGSNNQAKITFTNSNMAAFDGVIRIKGIGHGYYDAISSKQDDIKSITVANNQ